MNHEPYPLDVKPKKKSTGSKLALGCGCGCLVVFLTIIIIIVGLVVWLLGRSPLPDATAMMQADVDNVLVVNLEASDQGLLEFFKRTRELNLDVNQQLPMDHPLRKLIDLTRQSPGMKSQDLEVFLPIQVVLGNSCANNAWTKDFGLASFSRFVKPLSTVLKVAAKMQQSELAKGMRQEGGWSYFEAGPEVWLGIAQNNVVFARSYDRITQVARTVDQDPAPNQAMTELRSLVPKGALAYGIHTDRNGNIKLIFDKLLELSDVQNKQKMTAEEYELIKSIGLPLFTQNLTDIVWSLRTELGDVTKIDLNMGCKEAMFCEQIQMMLMLQKVELQKQLPPGLSLTKYDVTTEGARIKLGAEVKGLIDYLITTMKDQKAQPPAAEAQP